MRPIASISLDLDDQWTYMKTRGDPTWREFPSYLDVAVPRILEFLAVRDLTISFFVVGQDAAFECNHPVLRKIANAGHEIASHSFSHDPWLHLYSKQQLEDEFSRAEEAIKAATGVQPVGFRGPGFSLSASTLSVLAQRDYLYDATVFPNILNPLARRYFFARSTLNEEQRDQRKALFGTWRDGLRPVKPFFWQLSNAKLLEIPVTTMPVFKVPIHASYVVYLSKFSRLLAACYAEFAVWMCRLTRTEPSILLHPLDFLGLEDAERVAFFPGMDLSVEHKVGVVTDFFDRLSSRYSLVTMREHSKSVLARGGLRLLTPDLNEQSSTPTQLA